jgi:uncharacterized membrane protein YgcG
MRKLIATVAIAGAGFAAATGITSCSSHPQPQFCKVLEDQSTHQKYCRTVQHNSDGSNADKWFVLWQNGVDLPDFDLPASDPRNSWRVASPPANSPSLVTTGRSVPVDSSKAEPEEEAEVSDQEAESQGVEVDQNSNPDSVESDMGDTGGDSGGGGGDSGSGGGDAGGGDAGGGGGDGGGGE